MTMRYKLVGAVSGLALMVSAVAAQADVLFWSTQAKPAEESQAMRDQVLSGFDQAVDYQANDGGPWLTRLQAELQAGSGSIDVLGALHGDFSAMNPDDLVDLDDLGIASSSGTFNSLAQLGTDHLQYIPWMQASYIMAANREALPYLPEGADLNALTYDQLIQWAANVHEATGEPRFGFPAGERGLSIASSKAICIRPIPTAWCAPSGLMPPWPHGKPSANCGRTPTRPRPTSRSCRNSFCRAMRGSCSITPRVWHRLSTSVLTISSPSRRPLALLVGASCRFSPVLRFRARHLTWTRRALVSYMLQPETQIATLRATNFFPVVAVDLPDDLPPAVQAAGAAVAAMSASPDANRACCPQVWVIAEATSTACSSTASSVSCWAVRTSAPFWTNRPKSCAASWRPPAHLAGHPMHRPGACPVE
ncbi:MAG: carbohydrate ABC transporter substrate-binding protein [Paracoccaceae bacterium]